VRTVGRRKEKRKNKKREKINIYNTEEENVAKHERIVSGEKIVRVRRFMTK
jgi:hypothetical protein